MRSELAANEHERWAISVRGLRKSYGPAEAMRGISFEVRTGEVLGPSPPTA